MRPAEQPTLRCFVTLACSAMPYPSAPGTVRWPRCVRAPQPAPSPLFATSQGGVWGMQLGGGSSSSSASTSTSNNNTLVLKCEYYALADERSYAAIYVGPVPPGEDAVKVFTTREVMLHLAFRVDPNKSGGGLRQRFLQTYKVKGKWEDGPNQVEQKTWRAGEWPFKREFWLRMTIEPEGCFSYVNGKALGFTPHPGGGVWRPTGDPNLHVVLPVAGDTAEKPSWKVLEAYWGHCGVGEEGRALHTKWRETVGAAPQRRKVGIVDELWVTGLPAATEVGDVKAAFARFCTVLEVRLDGRGGGVPQVGGAGRGGGRGPPKNCRRDQPGGHGPGHLCECIPGTENSAGGGIVKCKSN